MIKEGGDLKRDLEVREGSLSVSSSSLVLVPVLDPESLRSEDEHEHEHDFRLPSATQFLAPHLTTLALESKRAPALTLAPVTVEMRRSLAHP